MGKAYLLILALAVTAAASTAGCFGGDETPSGGTNTTTNNTGRNNTNPTTPAPVTGGANITGAGPGTTQSVSIDVKSGHKTITITFVEKGPQPPIPAVPAQNFAASLKDPKGNETATSTATSSGITQTVAAGQAGTWTLDVSFDAAPVTTVEVIYSVT